MAMPEKSRAPFRRTGATGHICGKRPATEVAGYSQAACSRTTCYVRGEYRPTTGGDARRSIGLAGSLAPQRLGAIGPV